MASDNIEIEIRIRLDEQKMEQVRKKLGEIAEFVKSSSQKDEYFTPAHRNFIAPKFPSEWLSVRSRNGKTILNYKHFYPENVEITTHCNEFETEISDENSLQKILESLDFRPLMVIEKERDYYTYGDEFEIVLDNVKDLGFFVEIEALKDFGGHEQTKKRLMEFAAKIGIDATNMDPRGYIEMLLRKKGLIN